MLTQQEIYYGKKEALPQQIEFHAGPLTMLFEQGDLRYLRFGNSEVLRRIYIAVRDRNWGTIASIFSNLHIEKNHDSFLITFDVENKQNAVDFTWKGIIQGKSDGTVTYSMDGIARSNFWRNRIGFCILHPAFLAGSKCRVKHVGGRVEDAIFPGDFVSTQPVVPFTDMQSVSHQVTPGIWAEVTFSGDIFEMEDQRNWTDASFKTFCPPLRLPYPLEVQAGTKISQSIVIRLNECQPGVHMQAVGSVSIQAAAPILSVDRKAKEIALPVLGLGVASHGLPLAVHQLNLLRAMHLNHLRIDLLLSDETYPEKLALATRQANTLDLKLEMALLVSEKTVEELERLRRALDILHPPVLAWLCYPAKELFQGGSPIHTVVEAARRHLLNYDPAIPFCAGTNTDLIFMKRSVPPLGQIHKLCFAINPQVHAFDNASLIETLEVQGDAVKSAQQLGGTLPVVVSPITLKPRFNPYATGTVPAPRPGELPPQVDVRQMSLFGAGWTLGSYKYIADAEAASVTYYETSGWQGVMETSHGSLLPEIFRSFPDCVYPLYHVLADIGEFRGGTLLPVNTSHALILNGLLLRKGKRERMILANHSTQQQNLQIHGLNGSLSVRILDENSMFRAMQAPEQFRAAPGTNYNTDDGLLELTLLPYATATIDAR